MAKKNNENQMVFKVENQNLTVVAEKNKTKKQKKSKEDSRFFGSKMFDWLKLDNAATIYPSSKNEHWTFVYRISAIMKKEVDPVILQKSVDEIMPRFPSFFVCLKKGFFWHYFEQNNRRLEVEEEKNFPCSYMNINDPNKHLIRVIYSKYRISLEVFHAVSDGHGSLILFNCLMARYLENIGKKIGQNNLVLNYNDVPTAEELEDSFLANATNQKGKGHREASAYNIAGTVEDEGIVNTTIATMSVNQVKEVAKKYNAKLTSFLASVFGYEILKRRKNSKKPVKISIPIDMRKEFNSSTLRNFSSYINIPLSDEKDSLAEVIDKIKCGLEGVDREFLQKNINSNVNLQKNLFIKLIPLPIKNLALSTSFNLLGENLQTFAFSNLGKVQVPDEFYDEIERYEVNLGRSKHNAISVGLISFGDILTITISSKLCENTTERDVLRKLSEFGIDIKVESNRRDRYGK
ncbi:MAG: hypothetical protein K6F08_02850 [bacterium]|nr:hypothetical protein [bacterium]